MNSPTRRPTQTIILVLVVVGLLLLALGGYLSPIFRTILNPVLEAQAWLSSRFPIDRRQALGVGIPEA